MLDGPSARFLTSSTAVARRLCALFGAALALALGACSASTAADAGGTGGTTGSGGMGAMPGAAGLSFALSLAVVSPDDGSALDPMLLKPAEVANVVVTTMPPATHTVRFALLGSPLDAVLDSTFVDTDPDTGTGAVTLTAPSMPTSFTVRASSTGAPSFSVDLAVEETNMATLSVKPSYPGERVLRGYVASATPGLACTDLAGSPPDDGSIVAPMSDMWPIELDVPTGTKLAVVLRAEEFAWGCTTLNAALEDMENDVEVVMANVPMKLDSSNVGFELDLDSFDDFDQALAASGDAIASGVLGTANDDVQALLDAMAKETGATTNFDDTRSTNDWDAKLRAALGDGAAEALRAPLSRWIQAGVAALPTSGGLTGSLAGAPMNAAPSLTLDQVFGVPAAHAGFAPSGSASWVAGADDRVVMGMSMTVDPTAFLLAEAAGPALTEFPDATSLTLALAESLPCSTVAEVITQAHSKGDPWSNDAASTEQLCIDAVQTLTYAALDAGGAESSLDVALTASGSVGDHAELTSFSGRWLGHFTTPDGSISLTGAATSTNPPK